MIVRLVMVTVAAGVVVMTVTVWIVSVVHIGHAVVAVAVVADVVGVDVGDGVPAVVVVAAVVAAAKKKTRVSSSRIIRKIVFANTSCVIRGLPDVDDLKKPTKLPLKK